MNDYRAYVENDYNAIYHYGVLGMKWGVRRYQNYDGSYTRKGLQHYKKAEQKYEKADNTYKTAKAIYKNGAELPDGTKIQIDKQVVKEAKKERSAAKRELKLHYKLLKNDKMADQGKELYQKGETITGNYKARNMARLGIIGVTMANIMADPSVSNFGKNMVNKYGLQKVNAVRNAVYFGTVGATGLLIGKMIRDSDHDKKLRAYYSHKAHPVVKD